MKIARYELFKVPPRWLFLKIETDTGIVGWGEPVLEGKADTVRTAVDEMMDYLVGKDPMRIEDHWQTLYRGGFYRGGPVLMSAISGIEQALWDIKGRHYNAPVYDLLGGAARDRIKVYSWIHGKTAEDLAEMAKDRVAAGFTALKMTVTEALERIDTPDKVQDAAARVRAVREAVGNGIGIGVDFHGRVSKSMARRMVRELEPYGLMFIEEPVLPQHNEALREIAAAGTTPIATGERMFTRWEFKQLLTSGYVDVIQPDISHAGGVLEVRKIAAMAEAYDVSLAPHCPLGPIALAASLQVDACSPNAIIQEQSLGIHYNQGADLLDYLTDPGVFRYGDGFVPLPEGPGLGVDINEARVREAAEEGHRWRNPVWRHADGSVAEW